VFKETIEVLPLLLLSCCESEYWILGNSHGDASIRHLNEIKNCETFGTRTGRIGVEKKNAGKIWVWNRFDEVALPRNLNATSNELALMLPAMF